LVATKKVCEIDFTDPIYAEFAIYVACDTVKKNILTLDATAFFKKKAFRFASSDNRLTELTAEVGKFQRRINNAKNGPAKTAAQAQLAGAQDEQKQLTDAVTLAKSLNTQPIHYRIIIDHEKYPIEIYTSQH
jgi:hypothetical protein